MSTVSKYILFNAPCLKPVPLFKSQFRPCLIAVPLYIQNIQFHYLVILSDRFPSATTLKLNTGFNRIIHCFQFHLGTDKEDCIDSV